MVATLFHPGFASAADGDLHEDTGPPSSAASEAASGAASEAASGAHETPGPGAPAHPSRFSAARSRSARQHARSGGADETSPQQFASAQNVDLPTLMKALAIVRLLERE